MATTYWQTRKYVPDSDDEDDEDLAVAKDEQREAAEDHIAETHNQQAEDEAFLDISQRTKVQNEQEGRRTENDIGSSQSSQVIILKSYGRRQDTDLEIDTIRSSLEGNTISCQRLEEHNIEHAKDHGIYEAFLPTEDNDLFSISSSSLSSVPASSSPLSPRSPQLRGVEDVELPLQPLDNQEIFNDTIQQEYRPARELRARRAIQLNPYAVEGQLYKQAWRSRGLVPLQVQIDSQTEANNEIQPSSSQLEYQSESSDGVPIPLESHPEHGAEHSGAILPDLDDELNFLEPVSRLHGKSAQQRSPKRRKLTHTYSKRDRLQKVNSAPVGFRVREDGWIEVPFAQDKAPSPALQAEKDHHHNGGLRKSRSGDSPVLMTPISASRTSTTSSPDLPHEGTSSTNPIVFDEDTASRQLYTPITSSEARPRHGRRLVKKGDLNRSPQKSALDETNDSVVSVSTTSESEDEAARLFRQIATAQKRTKGVLPASWHRLEYQKLLSGRAPVVNKQPPSSSRYRPHAASPPIETRKGVAKRIINTHRDAFESNTNAVFEAFADDDSDDDRNDTTRPRAKVQQEINNFLTIDDHFLTSDDSNMEDNSIDAMATRHSTSKSGTTHKRTTKQPKIRDYLPSRTEDAQNRIPKSSIQKHVGKRRPGRQRPSITQRKQNRMPEILRISERLRREDTPKFLAYALRTAKQTSQAQHQSGRQRAPSSAVVHRNPRQQTSNIAQGHHQSRRTSQHLWRAPLQELSPNVSHLQRSTDGDGARPPPDWDAMQQQAQLFLTDDEGLNPEAEETGSKAIQPKKPARFLRKGHPIASSTTVNRSIAPAQLEAVNNNRRRQHSVPQGRKFVLDTFLQRSATLRELTPAAPTLSIPKTETRQRHRKRQPKQVPIATIIDDNQTGFEEVLTERSVDAEYSSARPSAISESRDLQLPVQPEYATTFSISRLPGGKHFNNGTLLGSGLFADSLQIRLGDPTGPGFRFDMDGETVEWSHWNEAVARQVFSICDTAIGLAVTSERHLPVAVTDNSVKRLRAMICYLSVHLKFLDSIDRRDFVARWATILARCESQLLAAWNVETPEKQDNSGYIEISCLLSVIANQIRQIAQDGVVDEHLKRSIFEATTRVLKCSLLAVFRNGFNDFSLFSQDPVNLANHVTRSKISRKIEALVVLFHLYQNLGIAKWTFWDVLKEQRCLVCPSQVAFVTLEHAWQNIFSLLPILELDSQGQAARHVTSSSRVPNWKLVKQLIEPVFAAYATSQHRSSINQYCWSLYARCHRLLDYWAWHDCESIMGFLFDFFAQNKLHDLRMESIPGSPNIMADLGSAMKLEVRRSDRCFQVLLKIIGKGLKTMRMQQNDKRIGNCVWRLTPNHDRSLPKDQALRQEDLDAVRNHLDLLAVLYWAAPPQYRIRIEVIQNLIDIGNSHREVCYLVIEKWHDLVIFQLSTQERSEKLDIFVRWWEEIVTKLARLYHLARTEVESDARQAAISRGQHFTMDEQERIIQASQHNVQSVVEKAFSSLRNAISKVHTVENLQKILPDCFEVVFKLWSANQPRTSRIMTGILAIVRAWIRRAQELETSADSQEYGDWAAFDELDSGISKKVPLSFPDSIRQLLQTFFANLFGSELAIEDDILHDSVDCWLELAEFDVKADILTWDDLIDPYNPRSWKLLRDTTQTRTFTSLFLTSLLRKDFTLYERRKSTILRQWIASLLERESLIKHQPDLTSTLFSQDAAEPLFQNQPFSKLHGVFNISLVDFLSKRVSLLACMLSNMRESLSFSTYHQLQDCQTKRKTYSELLRHLMDTLKSNFLNLGREPRLQEGYVKFAQQIVRLLQEHTADICKVDGFFLDAITFPLPAEDPEYLVSKLRSLALQSRHSRGLQQFGAFIQSLFERAVIEGRQEHFARLVFSAVEDVLETGRDEQPTLRSLICCQILPDYVGAATNTRCGWAIADTILLCVAPVLQTVRPSISVFDATSLAAGQSIIMTALNAFSDSIGKLLDSQPDFDTKSTALLTRYFVVIAAALPAWDPISCYASQHSSHSGDHDKALSTFFAQSAIYTIAKLENLESSPSVPVAPVCSETSTRNPSLNIAKAFIHEALFASLSETSSKCKWRFENDRLFVHRNARWDHVKFTLGSSEERRQSLLNAARSLLKGLQEAPIFSWSVTRMVLDVPYNSMLLEKEQKRIGGDSYII